jgi:pimeloyl-ACP methyl ester carboxylesterase
MKQEEVAFSHGMARIEDGVTLHYVSAGAGERTVVLLHGFPQTWLEWRRVISPLVQAGYRVVAPDYRGAGNSSRPLAGYDKRTMARDIQRLVREALDISGRLVLVGHDIGLMVAYAYAELFRDEVSHLAVIDAPLPGTHVFDRLRADPRAWHFAFHNVRDIPEMLIAGRERVYLPMRDSITPPQSPTMTSIFTRLPIQRLERCGQASNFTEPSIETQRTIGPRSQNAASSHCRFSQSAARSARLAR